MTNFSIERAVNKEFYALFTADNGEPVWKTTDTYTRKAKAFKAIGVFYNNIRLTGIVSNVFIVDNTLKSPTTKIYQIVELLKK